MRKTILGTLCALGIAASFGAAAHGPAGMRMGGTERMQASAHAGPASVQAEENANGRFSSDREFGLDRAAERRNANATPHEQADAQVSRHRHEGGHADAADEPESK